MVERKTKNADNRSNVGLTITSTTVTLQQEYELYDFGTIVGIVGGSLGLFLGFSCLQFGNWAVEWAFSRQACLSDSTKK